MSLETAICFLVYVVAAILLALCLLIVTGAWDIYNGSPKEINVKKWRKKMMAEFRQEEIELEKKIRRNADAI
jgi:hypothetical protein